MADFPFIKQLNEMDCGPTCLRMVAKYYGRTYGTETLRQSAGFAKDGVSLFGISEAAEKIGFRTRGVQLTYDQLAAEVQLPCMLHWDQSHFVVLTPRRGKHKGRKKIQIADPAKGLVRLSSAEFLSHWISGESDNGVQIGTALIMEPTVSFYQEEGEKDTGMTWSLLTNYLSLNKWPIIQVITALIVAALVQLIFPFLTQSVVDTGIGTRNLSYVTVVLIAQLMLLFSRSVVDFIRNRILLRISVTVNLSILSDFWIKLTKLPLSYFDRHQSGDIFQRLNDNKLVQSFLTGNVLNVLFSILTFLIYTVVLWLYNMELLILYVGGGLLYLGWVRLFMRVRRRINYQLFHISAKENNSTMQLVQGMQEIRLQNSERTRRWEWENIQAGIFKLNFKTLTYSQVQQAGALLINQGKDILITFLAAGLVIDGKLTLGAMLAIQYIIGQLSNPVEQFVTFAQNAQDARISMERLNEIHQMKDEENPDITYNHFLPPDRSIYFSDLSFSYPGSGGESVLERISLVVPARKVTAIVGVSGSGKTTLLKLLLKFYENYQGEISIGGTNFRFINHSFWRRQCGAVMQDGFIFNDSVARNIAAGEEHPVYERLIHACTSANILSLVESMPNGFHTRIGASGIGISQGQRQRLLIARAIYKEPDYLFFDEATNALDANNERAIVENLHHFFKGRTVIVVAHRLSTVVNADNIVVLHKGKIVESGTHAELTRSKGNYYELVRNQLELGS
jgi:ATP-binding cassette subfamily B protein